MLWRKPFLGLCSICVWWGGGAEKEKALNGVRTVYDKVGLCNDKKVGFGGPWGNVGHGFGCRLNNVASWVSHQGFFCWLWKQPSTLVTIELQLVKDKCTLIILDGYGMSGLIFSRHHIRDICLIVSLKIMIILALVRRFVGCGNNYCITLYFCSSPFCLYFSILFGKPKLRRNTSDLTSDWWSSDFLHFPKPRTGAIHIADTQASLRQHALARTNLALPIGQFSRPSRLTDPKMPDSQW